jgi:hypothetical protein
MIDVLAVCHKCFETRKCVNELTLLKIAKILVRDCTADVAEAETVDRLSAFARISSSYSLLLYYDTGY